METRSNPTVVKQTTDLIRRRLRNALKYEFESRICHIFVVNRVKTDGGMASNMECSCECIE